MKTFALAITHFNRFPLLVECLKQVLFDERVCEIVISDDASTDGSYEQIQNYYQDFPKVRIFRNELNLDCYFNKRTAVNHCLSDWVILFDSDNVLTYSYLETIYNLPQWDPNVLYCPEYAEPNFNYTWFAGKVVDHRNVAEMLRAHRPGPPPPPRPPVYPGRAVMARNRNLRYLHPNRSRVVTSPRPVMPPIPPAPVLPAHPFATVLNTANYFFHRQSYLDVWDGSVDPHTADSIFHAYNWLKAGKSVFVVPGLRYFHRIHDGSHYKMNKHKTGSFHEEVVAKLGAMK